MLPLSYIADLIISLLFFFLMIRRPPRSTLFPYTTLSDPASQHLLMELRHLSRHGDSTIPGHPPEVLQSPVDPFGRFEQNGGSGISSDRGQALGPARPRLRKEPFEGEPVRRKARSDERGQDRRRPGDDVDGDVRLDA